MEILQEMLPNPDTSSTPAKKSKTKMTKTGAKRALILFTILMMMTIIHTIIQCLSDSNVNALFSQLFSKINSFENLQNSSKTE